MGRFRGNSAALVFALLLLFPSSSVLCIAPGGHVAIEDINAHCSTSSGIIATSGHQPDFNGPATRSNCTDFLLTSNGCEVISPSNNLTTASPSADARFVDFPLAEVPVLPYQSGTIGINDGPIPVYPSVPLRC